MDDAKTVAGVPAGSAEFREDLLRVEHVHKSFPSDKGPVHVLQDVDLIVRNIYQKPQIVSFLGPSGCGKTTLLRIIAGLDQATRGTVQIAVSGSMRPVVCGDIGVVFQRYPLFDDLQVLQNLVEPGVRSGLSRKSATAKALQLLDECNLLAHSTAWPAQLSGGQRQRVAILQQLMRDRHFVILDEPFSGLDPVNVQNVMKLLIETAHRHTMNTFIIVTHDVESALYISDHLYLMGRKGEAKDTKTEGATITRVYNLIEEEIAWRPDRDRLPRFLELRREIEQREFPKL